MESLTPRPTSVDDLESEAHARTTDPTTSHLAAATVDLTRRQLQVLQAFREKATDDSTNLFPTGDDDLGFTDEEMVAYVQSRTTAGKVPSPSGLRTARKALVDAGLLEKYPSTGETGDGSLRKTALGNWAYVWVLTQAGRDFEVPQ